MGQILRASCKKCGLENKFCLGAGMSNFKTNCSVPGIDLKTNKFVVENYKNKEQLKGSILFYTEHELYEGEIETDLDSIYWMDNTIQFGLEAIRTGVVVESGNLKG